MPKKIFFILLGIVTLVLILFIVRFSSSEDGWNCIDGAWVRHGNPSAAMPTTACVGDSINDSQQKSIAIGLANPASVNCTEKGGTLQIEKRPDGGEFGVCYFEDNRQCEEWALMRGDCPVGGRKVTGYITEAGRYCAITGGEYTTTEVNDWPENEKGTCKLPGGEICEAETYYGGSCGT
ncbi:MAG: DUF333 domain-containing protein [Candidatus Uhrbacteria bacterium]